MNERNTIVTESNKKPPVSSHAKLIVTDGQNEREVVLGAVTSIGRDSKNSFQILDRLVSKEHCVIQFDLDHGFVIRDLGSSNGTFVNRMRIEGEQLLNNGDSINIGATLLTFVVEDAEAGRLSMDDGKELVQLKEIRSKTSPSQERFLPEKEIEEEAILRADYEKLRVTYELQRAIELELDIDRIFGHILEYTFKFLDCDRAVILMVDENGQVKPRALKTCKKDERMIISSTLVRKVQSEKIGYITADALTDKRFDCAPSIALQMVRSCPP